MEFKTEVVADDGFRPIRLITHSNLLPDDRGRFAMALIERWGLVAAKPDGEDSAGRAKLACLSPSEVVTRAIETAEEAYRMMAERGMLLEAPKWETLREMAREERERN